MASNSDKVRERRLRASGALSPQQSAKVIRAQLMEEGGITERALSGDIPTWAYLTAGTTLAAATFFAVRLYRQA